MMISVALCWSTMGVAFKYIDWDPLVIAAVRNLLTFLFLAAYRRSLKISFKKEVIVGAFIAYLTQTSFTYANKYTSAANAIVLQYTNPVFVLLISWLLLRQKIKTRDIVLSLIMIGGTALFFLDDLSAGQLLGNVCGCVVASGIATVLMAKAAPRLASVEVSMLLMLDPILNPVWVALVVGEVPGIFALIGMVIVIGCVVVNILVENHEEIMLKKVQPFDKQDGIGIKP